ncbi:hypothetical protein BC834DRAFT_160808 [Gloeopeniophorella convolvens]|nr:hypothetical protein BC834DRAFT_160808 [Gloeopeniophorella convolvens]
MTQPSLQALNDGGLTGSRHWEALVICSAPAFAHIGSHHGPAQRSRTTSLKMGKLRYGVQLMHEHNVAHRVCTARNIMLDPSDMYPESFHLRQDQSQKGLPPARGQALTRTQRPPRHLLIDFGLFRRYDPKDGPPLEEPLRGGDKTAPEHGDRKTPCDPLPTDVYYLGNLVRERFMQRFDGFGFIEPLIVDMVNESPAQRPNMQQVVTHFVEIRRQLGTWKLRSRIACRKSGSLACLGVAGHWPLVPNSWLSSEP